MLQAWIVSPHESLYFAAAASPCNLAMLHRHVRKKRRRLSGRLHVSLTLGLPGNGSSEARLAAVCLDEHGDRSSTPPTTA